MLLLVSGGYVELDADDLELVSGLSWSIGSDGYASYYPTPTRRELMHRVIGRPARDESVDHINGLGCDNRRSNLRRCTHAQNMRNRRIAKSNKCGFKGVYRDRNRWRARIGINGEKISLGLYDTPEMAYAAYCEAAVRYHGEFARFD